MGICTKNKYPSHKSLLKTPWFKIIIIIIIIIIILIIIIICHNGSRKPRKFSRSHMAKRTESLNSSREI